MRGWDLQVIQIYSFYFTICKECVCGMPGSSLVKPRTFCVSSKKNGKCVCVPVKNRLTFTVDGDLDKYCPSTGARGSGSERLQYSSLSDVCFSK